MELKHSINEIWSELLKDKHRIDVLTRENETLKAEIAELKSAKIDSENEAEAQKLLNEYFCGAKGDYR